MQMSWETDRQGAGTYLLGLQSDRKLAQTTYSSSLTSFCFLCSLRLVHVPLTQNFIRDSFRFDCHFEIRLGRRQSLFEPHFTTLKQALLTMCCTEKMWANSGPKIYILPTSIPYFVNIISTIHPPPPFVNIFPKKSYTNYQQICIFSLINPP